MDVVSLVQLFPPQHQLRFECPHVGFHVRDEQLQVKCLCSTTKFIIIKFVKLRADISEEAEPTEPNLVRELLKALEVPLTNEGNEQHLEGSRYVRPDWKAKDSPVPVGPH